jgi:hypothetical protein
VTATWITKVITDAPIGCVKKSRMGCWVGKAGATCTQSVIFQERVRKGRLARQESARLGSAEQAESCLTLPIEARTNLAL